jgi:trimethylamine-N-oxide reductase (cytochrome c)
MNLIGYTYADHNPDSWEGWHWGGMHQWGFSHRLGIPEQYDVLEDALKHTEISWELHWEKSLTGYL